MEKMKMSEMEALHLCGTSSLVSKVNFSFVSISILGLGGGVGARYLERLRLLLEREERLRDPSLWSEVPSLDDILRVIDH